jgi:quercetin dioxygenase-like cupin family protein
MNKTSLPLLALMGLGWWSFTPPHSYAQQAPVRVQPLLQATRSWDGTPYRAYPGGQPQVTVLKITVPPHTALAWHHHPMISAAYVLSGQLVVEKRATGQRKVIRAGQALAESVNAVHRGYTTDQWAELIVFYAGKAGLPLSIPAP